MAMEADELFSALICRRAGLATSSSSPAPETGNAKKEVKEKPKWGEPGSSKANKEAKAKPKEAAPVVPLVETPHGEKKDLSQPMAATYDPKAVESAWSAWWEKREFFTPDPKRSMELWNPRDLSW